MGLRADIEEPAPASAPAYESARWDPGCLPESTAFVQADVGALCERSNSPTDAGRQEGATAEADSTASSLTSQAAGWQPPQAVSLPAAKGQGVMDEAPAQVGEQSAMHDEDVSADSSVLLTVPSLVLDETDGLAASEQSSIAAMLTDKLSEGDAGEMIGEEETLDDGETLQEEEEEGQVVFSDDSETTEVLGARCGDGFELDVSATGAADMDASVLRDEPAVQVSPVEVQALVKIQRAVRAWWARRHLRGRLALSHAFPEPDRVQHNRAHVHDELPSLQHQEQEVGRREKRRQRRSVAVQLQKHKHDAPDPAPQSVSTSLGTPSGVGQDAAGAGRPSAAAHDDVDTPLRDHIPTSCYGSSAPHSGASGSTLAPAQTPALESSALASALRMSVGTQASRKREFEMRLLLDTPQEINSQLAPRCLFPTSPLDRGGGSSVNRRLCLSSKKGKAQSKQHYAGARNVVTCNATPSVAEQMSKPGKSVEECSNEWSAKAEAAAQTDPPQEGATHTEAPHTPAEKRLSILERRLAQLESIDAEREAAQHYPDPTAGHNYNQSDAVHEAVRAEAPHPVPHHEGAVSAADAKNLAGQAPSPLAGQQDAQQEEPQKTAGAGAAVEEAAATTQPFFSLGDASTTMVKRNDACAQTDTVAWRHTNARDVGTDAAGPTADASPGVHAASSLLQELTHENLCALQRRLTQEEEAVLAAHDGFLADSVAAAATRPALDAEKVASFLPCAGNDVIALEAGRAGQVWQDEVVAGVARVAAGQGSHAASPQAVVEEEEPLITESVFLDLRGGGKHLFEYDVDLQSRGRQGRIGRESPRNNKPGAPTDRQSGARACTFAAQVLQAHVRGRGTSIKEKQRAARCMVAAAAARLDRRKGQALMVRWRREAAGELLAGRCRGRAAAAQFERQAVAASALQACVRRTATVSLGLWVQNGLAKRVQGAVRSALLRLALERQRAASSIIQTAVRRFASQHQEVEESKPAMKAPAPPATGAWETAMLAVAAATRVSGMAAALGGAQQACQVAEADHSPAASGALAVQSVSKHLDAESDGDLKLPGGSARLSLPCGALLCPELIGMQTVAVAPRVSTRRAATRRLASRVVHLSPSGIHFKKPVTLELVLDSPPPPGR